MFENLGPTIRTLRKQKGIGLNTFAEQLSVSPGYLSNLETAKTDTVSLELLSRLQQELQLFPSLYTEGEHEENQLQVRLVRLCHQLQTLSNEQPAAAEYLIKHVEEGIRLFRTS